jgi:hypothetical protein
VAETGKYQTVALVQAKNGHVVVGSSSNPSPQADAFAQYAAFLGVAGAAAATSGEPETAGTIDRIGVAPDGTAYLTLRASRRIYTIAAHDAPSVLLARPGDRVRFRTAPAAGDGYVAAGNFSDAALTP